MGSEQGAGLFEQTGWNVRLAFEYVESGSAEMSRPQGVDDRVRVDERPAAHVYEQSALWHERELGRADEVPCRVG